MAAIGGPAFRGRAQECALLDQALGRARAGESAVLVLRGEAGIGKTALLHYCAQQASGCRVAEIAAVEAELEMPFAALHQLCLPMLDNLDSLPEPQKQALRIAFGLSAGNSPDRFVVGLAVLSLLAEVAAEQPLVCLVDDAQWLDELSLQVLGFVGRRLLAEAVLLVFAAREEEDDRCLPSLEELNLRGLADDDARSLLSDGVAGKLDEQVRDRIVAETRGNPLGLVESPRAMSRAELAGGFAIARSTLVSGQLHDHYMRRVGALPESTQRLMLLAAADPTGDATVFWRAAHTFDVEGDAAAIAETEQLLEIGSRVRFRHPLVRSASYAVATAEDRCAAHLALAAAANEAGDRERRVWHRAAAATGPDEAVASELESAADTARARAGSAAAAAFLERAVALTAEPTKIANRALAAAEANVQAGAFDSARSLLAQAAGAAIDDLQRAQVEQLRGQIEWEANPGREAPLLLVQAAKRLESLNVSLARETYLHAWIASVIAGPLAAPGGQLVEVSRAAASVAAAEPTRPCDLLLDGFAAMILVGRTKAQSTLRRAVDAFLAGTVSAEDSLAWSTLPQVAAIALWDFDSYKLLSSRHVEVARKSGALSSLSMALAGHGAFLTWCGEFEAATALADERHAVNEVTGTHLASTHDLMLAGYRGRPAEALPLFTATIADAKERGEGWAVHLADWAASILHNGLGQYENAVSAAESASEKTYMPMGTQAALPELIEAATRTGKRALAESAMNRLSEMTVIEDADWAAGMSARCRALVSEGDDAEQSYCDAIERLGRTPLRPDLSRAQLLYGEWLRRESRRVDARQQLRVAHETFVGMGAEAFAERARRELVATGETVRRRAPDTRNDLTPQEAHVARLARVGQTNAEIAAELFLSARTVEWHLRKVYNKLGIATRRDLKNVLPATPGSPT